MTRHRLYRDDTLVYDYSDAVAPPVDPTPPVDPPPPTPGTPPPYNGPINADLGAPGEKRPWTNNDQPIAAGVNYAIAFTKPAGSSPTLRVQGAPGTWFNEAVTSVPGVSGEVIVRPIFSAMFDVDISACPPGRWVALFRVGGVAPSGPIGVQLF
jgi:hypothetical protein